MNTFYSFEGPEATGKSTIIQKIHSLLSERGHLVVKTREPGGSQYGEKIRQLIFNAEYTPSIQTELLLMFAARRDHIDHIIKPALNENKIVLTDRYCDSSYVYQSLLGGIEKHVIDSLMDHFIAPYIPHKSFFIFSDPEISFQRLEKRGVENRYDQINKKQIITLHKAFEQRLEQCSYGVRIENNGHIDDAVQDIMHYIEET